MSYLDSKLEVFLTLLLLIAVGYHAIFLLNHGYLGQPFFYDKSDTFMDFFHTEYWAFDQGRYSEWQSIYTPFSFVLAQLVACNVMGGLDSAFTFRQEDMGCFLFFVLAAIFASAYLVYRQYKSLYAVALVVFSAPLLFAMERGNLLIFLLPFLLIFSISKNNVLLGVILGLAISLKIYLLALLFVFLLMRNYVVLLLSVAVFFVLNQLSAILIGADDWFLFVQNIFQFSGEPKFYEWAYFSYSYRNLLLGFAEKMPMLLDWLMVSDLVVVLFCLMLFALSSLKFMQFDQDEKQKKLPIFMLLLLMLILIVVKNAGGYAFILLLPFFMAIKLDTFQKLALFLLVLPVGIQLAELNNFASSEAFFSGEVVDFVYVVDTGMVLRPLIFLVLYIYLSLQFVYGNSLERRVVYG
jgi:hypothetical protein